MADGADVSLDDKYRLDAGRALITGRQALVRLPLVQRELDRRAGLNTAGLISGYRGSPLGGYDAELWKVADLLKANDIVFQPGLNEDLALTALAGSQQLDYVPGATVDGVFAIWYGKGPGVDRSGDAIKHANLQGTSPHGGVLLAFGDDHAGKSSTTAHQSDLTLASWEVPVLYPASVAEILEYGLAGFAMSRFSGALVGLKLVNETAEGAGVVDLSELPAFVTPEVDGPPDGVHIRREPRALQARDMRMVRHKLPRAQAFARANRLDRISFGHSAPRFLIATAGKAYADTLAALDLLGVTQAAAERIGLGVYKIALLYPLDPAGLAEAASAAEEVLFVEEKRAHAEAQAKALLYAAARRPRITGKASPDGAPLLPADMPLDASLVAAALAVRLHDSLPDIAALLPGWADAVERLHRGHEQPAAGPLAMRRPAFCPGCPHNTSTRVPEGSFGATGIGCHSMVVFHPERNPIPMGQMGAEGANWIGLSPFTTTPHVFQNLGDGTYSHSGSLAIRAAVLAGVNITFKILFNDAVAMTGGQPVEGNLTVARVVEQVRAEGVGRIVVLSDNPDRFRGADALPAGTELRHRDELALIQDALKVEPGVTVIVYDQVCAAEKRRRRKAGTFPEAAARVFINPEVCEGCGDCSVQSNCLAIQPLETELGRKRRIDQSACNADFSCLKGFCPSFVTVEGVRPRRAAAVSPGKGDAPPPAVEPRPIGEGFDLVIAGVGGTGVVTISAVLGMAARIDGLGVSLFDMTGLSQKGGQVFSHLRLRADPDAVVPARVGPGEANMLLACDLVAGVQGEALEALAPGRGVVSAHPPPSPTADFQANRDQQLPAAAMIDRLGAAAGRPPRLLAASSLSQRLLGDSIGANMLMLGAAWQGGAIPVSLSAIEQAIRLNGVAVKANLAAFEAGRRAAVQAAEAEPEPLGLDAFISRRVEDLGRYRNAAYAGRYAGLMQKVRAAADAVAGGEAFAWAAARGAYKLMAYKDEYEVARLYSDGRFKAALEREFEGGGRLKLHLSPPILAGPDPRTGRPRKMAFGPWIFPALSVLASLKGLREGPLDPFGHTAERRRERELRDLYLARVARLAERLTGDTLAAAVTEASAPLDVRGYGPVKAVAEEALLAALRAEAVDMH